MINTFILILFIANTRDYRSGAAGISQEFNSEKACMVAGKALSENAAARAGVLTWGCFAK